MKKVILSMIVLAAMFSVAQAAPFQTLGMLRTPDAYVLPHKAAEFLLVGYYRDVAKPTPPADRKDDYKSLAPYGMIGIGILDRLELGLFVGDYTEKDGMVYFLNAKVKIFEETLRIPQLTIGMDNILSPLPRHKESLLGPADNFYSHPDRDSYEPYSAYLVGSKQAVFMGIPWMLNLGVGTNRFVGQQPRSRFFNGVFTSLEVSPIRDLSMQFEYDGEDMNAGIKYSYKNFGIKLAGAAMEDWAKDNGYEDNVRFAVGLSYLFDKFAEAKRRPDIGRYAEAGELEGMELVEVGETIVSPTEPGTGLPGSTEVVVAPGTQLQTPGLVTQSGEGYKELSPEVRDLLEELRVLREERQKAQQAMDDLRKWIQDLKKTKE